uniref:GlsB/YeaQ/YmgE family stress response membrane protein n=1 Tax=Polaribacter sp. TaxID=1920175 RepID=UPI0040488F04
MLYTILIVALAGFLAGKMMKGGGYGFLMNVVLGILGGAVGNWLFNILGFHLLEGIVGDLLTGVIGAAIVLSIAGYLKK